MPLRNSCYAREGLLAAQQGGSNLGSENSQKRAGDQVSLLPTRVASAGVVIQPVCAEQHRVLPNRVLKAALSLIGGNGS